MSVQRESLYTFHSLSSGKNSPGKAHDCFITLVTHCLQSRTHLCNYKGGENAWQCTDPYYWPKWDLYVLIRSWQSFMMYLFTSLVCPINHQWRKLQHFCSLVQHRGQKRLRSDMQIHFVLKYTFKLRSIVWPHDCCHGRLRKFPVLTLITSLFFYLSSI